MSTLTRSATLPYATADAGTLIATARRLLLDPRRDRARFGFSGVGFSGLSDVRQESLFPDLDQTAEAELSDTRRAGARATCRAGAAGGSATTSAHPEFGHGWVQGAGHGVVTRALRDPRQRAGVDADRSPIDAPTI